MREKIIKMLTDANLIVRDGTVKSELYVSNGEYAIVVNLPADENATTFSALIWAGTESFDSGFVLDENKLLDVVREAFEAEKNSNGQGMTSILKSSFPEIH